MPSPGTFHITVEPHENGKRLDAFLSDSFDDCSRSFLSHLIQSNFITVDGTARKPAYRVQTHNRVAVVIPPPEPSRLVPEALHLDVLHDEADLLVLNKAPGVVVHPAPGHAAGTIVNALLHRYPDIGPIGAERRPGIVHRLDKDTSGVMLVAKTATAHAHLTRQFARRRVGKTYLALVYGVPAEPRGSVVLSIGRHPSDRKRMSVASRRARKAETAWEVRERYDGISLLALTLKTGRTHQARVHCAAMGHPIVGDPVYGRRKAPKTLPPAVSAAIRECRRQMLHAWRLTFHHPSRHCEVAFEAPLASDMATLIDNLRTHSQR
jgi:23S rRNA pseudouridine1911/1915/1917 synthase